MGVDQMGVDQMGVDETGVDEMGTHCSLVCNAQAGPGDGLRLGFNTATDDSWPGYCLLI